MRNEPERIKVTFSVTNCICHDQRVLKIAETVAGLGCDIKIIGRYKGKCCKADTVPFKTKRFKMIFKKGVLFYSFFNIRLFLHLIFRRQHILVANDLDTLLPNYLVSKIMRISLVYDSHEYFTGVPEIQDRWFVKWVWKTIERSIFPKLKHIITVSDPIALKYENEYGEKPLVVRNCSRNSDNIVAYSRIELGVDPNDILLILQGTGINIDRGGEELVEAVSRMDGVSLIIVGSGDLIEIIRKKVLDNNLTSRIKIISKVPWNELIKYTKAADFGVSLDKNTNLNYQFSLPNKLFDYICAGIPVIASDIEEVKKIIVDYNCGLIVPEVTPEAISAVLNELKANKDKISELKKNSVIASKYLNWENESGLVVGLYKDVIDCIKN